MEVQYLLLGRIIYSMSGNKKNLNSHLDQPQEKETMTEGNLPACHTLEQKKPLLSSRIPANSSSSVLFIYLLNWIFSLLIPW